MKFTKMNGLGNDYIFVNTADNPLYNPSECAIRWSDRHRSIGGDGLVLIEKSECADLSMRIFNADGSEGETCGNALRCIGKYAFDKKLVEKTALTVETRAGVRQLSLKVKNNVAECISVNMGKPDAGHADNGQFIRKIEADGKIYRAYCISVGNPHCVIFVGHFAKNLTEIGRTISENTANFPCRTNVEFVLLDSAYDILTVRVYERGAGETMACGSGGAAVFYVANQLKLVSDSAIVRLPGGDLSFNLNSDGEVFMEGTAEWNFEGEI